MHMPHPALPPSFSSCSPSSSGSPSVFSCQPSAHQPAPHSTVTAVLLALRPALSFASPTAAACCSTSAALSASLDCSRIFVNASEHTARVQTVSATLTFASATLLSIVAFHCSLRAARKSHDHLLERRWVHCCLLVCSRELCCQLLHPCPHIMIFCTQVTTTSVQVCHQHARVQCCPINTPAATATN